MIIHGIGNRNKIRFLCGAINTGGYLKCGKGCGVKCSPN